MRKWRCCGDRVAPVDGAHDEGPDRTFVRSQKCQDVVFFIGYVIYIGAFIGIWVYCFQNCSFTYVLLGGDSWGNVCGGAADNLVRIKGLEEYSQLKVDSINVWRVKCNDSDVRICVKECPVLPLNSSSCKELLRTNGYEANEVAKRYCADQCFRRKQGNVSILITNRCMDEYDIDSSYSVVKGFVTEFHYATIDVSYAFVAGMTIVIFAAAWCILANVFFIRSPNYGSIFCYGACMFFSAIMCIQASIGLVRHAPKFQQELEGSNFKFHRFLLSSNITVFLLATISSYGMLIYTIYKVAITKNHFGKARGLWLSASNCIGANPKILSQPLLTLFACSVAVVYIIGFSFLLFDCHSLKRSPVEDKMIFESSTPVWMFALVMLCYTWYVNLVARGQAAVLSGAAAAWYFTKHDHPISFSLRAILKYNLGSLVGATFSGRVFGACVRLLCRTPLLSSVLPYFSNGAPISIGVYGKVKKLALEENTQGDHPSQHVAQACEVVRNALLTWKVAITEFSVCVFLWATNDGNRFYMPIVPVFLTALSTWNVAECIGGCMRDTMTGIAVCICEDFARNNGEDRLYYCDRKVAHLIYGVIIPLAATRYGKERLERQQKHARKASLFAFNGMWTRQSVRSGQCFQMDVMDAINSESRVTLGLSKFRLPRSTTMSPNRRILKDENSPSPSRNDSSFPTKEYAGGGSSAATAVGSSVDCSIGSSVDNIIPCPEPTSHFKQKTDAGLHSSEESSTAASRSKGARTEKTSLVTFTDDRKRESAARHGVKMLFSSSKKSTKQVKTIKTVRKDNDANDDWA